MKADTVQRGFPTALLTFSVLLVVLAIGFVVGRVVVAPAYLGAAPRIEAQGVVGSELDPSRSAPGHVYVPSPSGSSPPEDESERRESAGEAREPGPAREGEEGEGGPPTAEGPIPLPEAARAREEGEGAAAEATAPRREVSPGQRPAPSEETEAGKSSKTYSIQVGVFSSLQGARQVVDDLARGGYAARISPDKRSGQALYRVLTGRYQSEYAARKALEQLRTEGFEAFLVEQ